ncbi:alpha/beta hydrolase fold [Rubrobacter xylanophilus DSM 9941]|uniref:Alpha/beta hydrolase fold n=1 Tax=Rubrobacter xylanophilus (strain DSM 9941 / JCM 11954 / NBRC 16129 / PRD-1) TaxID=266117 RepID=Q1AYQ9_RUBXD|nr:alpha/beta fold hydrolase [Rubrobacter xylanophilus]ABG03469.1 alpha/beta hydrolase fold [Rubrobacter xylanophilus DSM 9941]
MRLAHAALAAAGTLGALHALNRRLERSGGPPRATLGGERRRYGWREGKISYSVAGEGPPLLLVHGIYAGASSLEFRKNFGPLSRHFTVYAPDLLGCGASERPRRRYSPEDITSQIEDFAREEIGRPVHLVASSLSATLALPAAVRSPRLFRSLVLICPTGLGTLDRPSGRLGEAIYRLLASPLAGDLLYHALVSRRGIRLYLERMAYHDPSRVTEELVEDYHRAGHGPNAKYLPASFVAGRLNLPALPYWTQVRQRAMVCWGEEARTPPPSELDAFLRYNPRTAPRLFRGAALLPHDERAEDFNREVADFVSAGKVRISESNGRSGG